MKKKFLAGLVCGLLVIESVFGTPNTEISYTTANLGSNRWQYTYEVTNIALSTPIEEFTIWFDLGSYDNLTIETADPPASNWDQIVWQLELGLGNGGYDALALSAGIGAGESVGGFSVSFDWLGTGVPDSQFYEIVNPTDFTGIDSGYTVPEPATCLLLFLGTTYIAARRHRN